MNLKIAKDFSTAPGPREITEGKYSGELFRKEVLLPKVLDAMGKNDELVVDLDGTSGYGTSFLEEAFGGLIRENGLQLPALKKTLRFISIDEPELLDEIEEYMRDAQKEKGLST